MYAYIKGRLEFCAQDFIIVEAAGIGYRIYTTAESMKNLPGCGQEVKIYTYLHIREDQMTLFGFFTEDDLRIFKLLIGVSGIGPKGALAILSVMTADDLRFAVLSDDAKAIAKAPGVGAKTAQRLILELKDKLSLAEAFEQKSEHIAAAADQSEMLAKNDAIQALTALGYTPSEALKAVNCVAVTEESTVEDILKAALKSVAFL